MAKKNIGCTWDKSKNKWLVRYGRKGYYGRYDSIEEARAAYKRAKAGIPYEKSSYDTKNNLRNEKGSKSQNWKGGKPSCLDCSKKLGNYNTKRCWTCANKAKSQEKSHLWKGGITKKNDLERSRFRHTMQQKIFIRDNYTCQICDQYSGSLQVDHIKSWADYPELRFEESNCRTLCMACHYYVTFKRKLPQGVVWGHNFNRRIES